jgi:hypothetical protein
MHGNSQVIRIEPELKAKAKAKCDSHFQRLTSLLGFLALTYVVGVLSIFVQGLTAGISHFGRFLGFPNGWSVKDAQIRGIFEVFEFS